MIHHQITGGTMRKSPILAFCLALTAGDLLATVLNRPSVGQPPAMEPLPPPQPGAAWRYQVTVAKEGNYPLLILTDTATGHCWVRESNFRHTMNGSNGSTQLMRGIGNKATLLREGFFQPFYHLVKDEGELLYLIPCLWNRDPLVQIFRPNLVRCSAQSMKRPESPAR